MATQTLTVDHEHHSSSDVDNASSPCVNPARRSGCPLHALCVPRGVGESTRSAWFAYGLLAYAAFLVTITYAIGFVGDWLVPKSIDTGTMGDFTAAILINVGLLALFAVQHTIMARPAFKKWWTTIIPEPIERSTFVLVASVILGATFALWRPIPTIVWTTDVAWLRIALHAVSLIGWSIVFTSSMMICHFDLFGLRQVWLALRQRPYTHTTFGERGFYRFVRHPLMTGFLIAFWATPTMTAGHLLFAGLCTVYILIGTRFEERDLVAALGDQYRHYQAAVPALVPHPFRRRPSTES
ncbi:MAG: isoprenylcysteine carboxylmethyltransferase family protein [Phycisphaerales bacterium]|nr:isoprenylcysteine carboxylmethyltransferase family protein [Phycisphaerales bacterium]